MLVKINSAALLGIDAILIEVEVDYRLGPVGEIIVGLPDQAVKESRERIKSALKNSSLPNPLFFFTINLAPADIPKKGPSFDLPIALGILATEGTLDENKLSNSMVLGELSLDGSLRPVEGVLPIAELAKKQNKRIILPKKNAKEASLIKDLEIIPIKNLSEAYLYFKNKLIIEPYSSEDIYQESKYDDELDLSDVKGQLQAKRALEISASGGHNLLLIGSPGCGKTMLARRFSTILPALNKDEIIDVIKIYSAKGLLKNKSSFSVKRPFRSPHHTASYFSLTGGGTYPKPGEISLSHNGTLLLDELAEFKNNILETLRQPLEDGYITISRSKSSLTFPSRFILLGTMNPCRCGFALEEQCQCSPSIINKYWSRISGPLLDRIDLIIHVPKLSKEELLASPSGETSKNIKTRVLSTREIQHSRFNNKIKLNSNLSVKEIKTFCSLNDESSTYLKEAIFNLNISGRTYHKILKVARTIADMESTKEIKKFHLAESISYCHFRKIR